MKPLVRERSTSQTKDSIKQCRQIRIFVFANATVYASSLTPNGFQLPFASTVRNEPDIMLGVRVQTVAYLTMQFMNIPEVFRSPLGSSRTMHVHLAIPT